MFCDGADNKITLRRSVMVHGENGFIVFLTKNNEITTLMIDGGGGGGGGGTLYR